MNGNALVDLVNSFLNPATTAFMVLIPSAIVVYCGWQALVYFQQSEQEQQSRPYWSRVKTAILIGIFMFSLSAILKIFGIN